MGAAGHRWRWATAPTDRRAKAAVLLAAVPFGIAVAALVGSSGGSLFLALGAAVAACGAALVGAAWLLAPPVSAAAMVRVARVRAAEKAIDLDVHAAAPRRANIVIPIVDLQHFFGGNIGVFNLARRLGERGLRVRLVTADLQPRLPLGWQRELERYEGLADVFDTVEVEFAGDGVRPLEVSPQDSFLAVSAWTARLAHRATAALGGQRIVHLIQDYDALSFPNGSMAAIARDAYRLPHYAVFSTEPLRDYFRLHRLGVFAEGEDRADARYVVFRSAITPTGRVTGEELSSRPRRALLFYARPDEHAARNMFELGLVALSNAIEAGTFPGEWRFAGVGSVKPLPAVDLPGGRRLELLPRTGQREYAGMLRQFSLGLSLMDTPHPSLPPIEMAAAGLVVVTSTYENKDAATLSAISRNLVAAPPTPAGVTQALHEAAARIDDVSGRLRGAALDWPTSWEQALDDRVVARVAEWLDER